MNLPDLNTYLQSFRDKHVAYPLRAVPERKDGLLKYLPPPPPGKTGWPWDEETDPALFNQRLGWPKFTIVSPSYNQDKFLEQTIRSVLLQNYPKLEYIVLDGGSSDGSRQILEKYSPWLSYWQSEKDNGQSQAINMGFSLSSGEYHAWINSDDYYVKKALFKVTKKFITEKVAFIYGYGKEYDVEKDEFKTNKILPFPDYFIKIPGIIQPSAFWRADIHEPVWEELHCALDFELWLRLVKGHRRLLMKEPLSVANVHDQAKTYDPKIKAKWEEDHQKIWAPDAHGTVHEWKKIVFLNRVRNYLYRVLKLN